MAKQNQAHSKTSEGRGQSAIEYLTTYGWAILIVTLIVSIFYFYISVPRQVIPNTCNFVSNIYCNDIVIGTNTTTHATILALLLINSQQNPIVNPTITTQVNLVNSPKFNCSPNFVLPGGTILCTANLPINTTPGSLVSGRMYLNATYCGLSIASFSSGNCSGGANQTYVGSFALHTQPLISSKTTLNLTAANFTEVANNNLDRLTATVNLLGYPLRGATVGFIENNTAYLLQPNYTLSDIYGNTLNYISGTLPGKVKVTASYAGLNSSIVITFVNPVFVDFIPKNFTYCNLSGPVALIDGVQYTCSQLSNRQFAYPKGTRHSYSFINLISIPSGIREIFSSVRIRGINYVSPSGNIVVSTNLTIPFSYYPQYYFGENASPVGAGIVAPGSNWYNATASVLISESQNSQYYFRNWTCTGTGCYAGTQTTVIINIDNPINETANYYSTSISTTSSTSSTSIPTTSTSTSTTSTSTTSPTTMSSTSTSTTSTSTSTSTTSPTTMSTTSSSTSTSTTSTSTSTTSPTTMSTTSSSTSTSTTSTSTSSSISTTSLSTSSTSTSVTTSVTTTSTSSTTISSTILYYYINSSIQNDPGGCAFGCSPGDIGPSGLPGASPEGSTGGGCMQVAQHTGDAYTQGATWTLYKCLPGTSAYFNQSGTNSCETIDAYMNLFDGSGQIQYTDNGVLIQQTGSCPGSYSGFSGLCSMHFTNLQANISVAYFYTPTYCPS